MKFIILILLLQIIGCSFKNPADNKTSTQLNVDSSNLDSDGDGILDSDEVAKGLNAFVANIPSFQGEFFSEMKLTTSFYDRATNKSKDVSFQVRKNVTRENGTPVEERDFLAQGTQFLTEQNALLAKKSNFKLSSLILDITEETIGLYAPPRMNDLQIFPFSEKVMDLSTSHQFESMDFAISNRMKFNYINSQTYTDLVFDLFWYDDNQKSFKLIGTDFLSGSYLFNEEYVVPLQFSSNDKDLVREISLSGGRFLYLKLRDFKIQETGKFYRQILTQVKEKSVPVLYYDGETEVLKYVGVNGKSAGLVQILNNSLSEKFYISNSKILSIGKKVEQTTIERTPFNEGEAVQYQWQILTNEISNNPFGYSFGPGDVITLSYLSSEGRFNLIPSYIGASISSSLPKAIKTIKVLSSNLGDIRLNLRPHSVTYSKQNISRLLPCNIANLCWQYSSETATVTGVEALQLSGLIYLTINGIEFRLDDLISSKDALFRIKNSEVIEVKLKNSLISKLPRSNGLAISFSIKPSLVTTCSGVKTCTSPRQDCDRYLASPPTCNEANNSELYQIHDLTQKSLMPITGDGFLSIEYI